MFTTCVSVSRGTCQSMDCLYRRSNSFVPHRRVLGRSKENYRDLSLPLAQPSLTLLSELPQNLQVDLWCLPG